MRKEQFEQDKRNREAAEAVLKNPERYPQRLARLGARTYITKVYEEEQRKEEEQRRSRKSKKPRLQDGSKNSGS
jgi:hypothetical protein